jgi:hypothetical protein
MEVMVCNNGPGHGRGHHSSSRLAIVPAGNRDGLFRRT